MHGCVVLQALNTAEQAVEHCSTSDEAPVVVYVSKMVAVPAAALPRSAAPRPQSSVAVYCCVIMRENATITAPERKKGGRGMGLVGFVTVLVLSCTASAVGQAFWCSVQVYPAPMQFVQCGSGNAPQTCISANSPQAIHHAQCTTDFAA